MSDGVQTTTTALDALRCERVWTPLSTHNMSEAIARLGAAAKAAHVPWPKEHRISGTMGDGLSMLSGERGWYTNHNGGTWMALERRGLVSRSPGETKHSNLVWTLTPAGRALFEGPVKGDRLFDTATAQFMTVSARPKTCRRMLFYLSSPTTTWTVMYDSGEHEEMTAERMALCCPTER